MITSDTEFDLKEEKTKAKKTETVEELSGALDKQTEEEKLMHSVIENDKDTVDDGKLIADSLTQGLGGFTPDLIYENLVKDYKLAEQLYGEVIVKELTGYSPDYVEKNIKIPEFKKLIKEHIEQKIRDLQKKKLLDNRGTVTDKGLLLSSLVLYVEELDHLMPKGFGEKKKKEKSIYGEKNNVSLYKKSRYRDLAIKASIKKALRRGHTKLDKQDLMMFERENKGRISIIYGLDASGSMRGEKLKTAKKAGIALCYKAIAEKNKVGLIVFGSDIKTQVAPTTDFMHILRELAEIKASNETDIQKTILRAIELFPKHETKHLILLTDAMPTRGKNPEKETLEAVSSARNHNITLSMIGINLSKEGLQLAEKMVALGNGRLYQVRNLEQMDKIILEDYYAVKSN
ncbi:VWA domain-containing protein [Candidatus Woesearchaeota archaeon]|nr:MAG: VWA domain-containing protein [Candidatus Woesearchaeota archaeon]